MNLKTYLKKLLLKTGVVVKRATDKEKVAALINRLHPHAVSKEFIRMGPKKDGGYLLPDDLEGIEACFSPGVERMSLFEEDCFKRNLKIFLADKSIEKPSLELASENYSFIKKHIGCVTNQDYVTLDSWVNSADISKDSDLLLQMDIEFGEYVSLINISDSLIKRFRILIVEFHRLQKLWDPDFFNIANIIFDKILQTHHCVHIHPNNYRGIFTHEGIAIPEVSEFTFLRNDRDSFKNYQTQFPHKLDFPNYTEGKNIILPKNWYQSS
jgi:hypothetical protein